MKITGLKAENIKSLKVVEIKPDGSIVKLSGKNGAGKSTVMDSMAYALGGKRLIPDVPIRKGEDKAEITVKLDNGITVTRRFKRSDDGYTTALKVTAADGASYGKAQDVLDKLTGELSFDPFAFSTMTDKDQSDLLKSLVDIGIDPVKWQEKHDSMYQDRRDANRDVKTADSKLTGMPSYDDVPAEEVSAGTLSAELIEAKNAHTDRRDLEKQLADAEQVIKDKQKEVAKINKSIKDSGDLPDVESIEERMGTIEKTNAMVRDNIARKAAESTLKSATGKADKLNVDLTAHIKAKADAIKDAEYPVDGLEFGPDGLLFNGTPLSEASAGQKIKVSALIGMALNPELKVLFIRNASLIDAENFAILSEVASGKDYQIWCEIMDESGEVGIYLEDGEVK